VTVDPEQDVAGPAGPIPLRHPRSIRRTATIDMTWPDGAGTPMRLEGRARDLVTTTLHELPQVVSSASTHLRIASDRAIVGIEANPHHPGVARLVGSRGGGHLRGVLDHELPGERAAGSTLYLLLDDVSGTSLIGGIAWSRWPDKQANRPAPRISREMASVCIGFRPGSQALIEIDQPRRVLRSQPVGPLVHPDDPLGWHELPELPDVSTRRARFIDVWLDDGQVMVESGFQDSAGDPDHGRIAIHEYRLRASADQETMTLRSLDPDARVLPFRECPAAVATSSELIGLPFGTLREAVLEKLARTNGCTHLNDALRALADVPVLVEHLERHLAA
jgi:hypothetical protein